MPRGLDTSSKYYRLCKPLYGLASAPVRWFDHISQLSRLHTFKSSWHPCLFYASDQEGGFEAIVCVFVDDLKVFCKSETFIKELMKQMETESVKITVGHHGRYLGMKWNFDLSKRTCTVSRQEYIQKIAEGFGMSDYKPIGTPAETNSHLSKHETEEKHPLYAKLVGKLMFAINTRFDIAYSVKELARHLHRNGDLHRKAAKRVSQYLKGTANVPLLLRACEGNKITLSAFTDAAWKQGGTGRGTSGGVLAIRKSAIAMLSQTQHCVTLSSCEAEIYAGITLAMEVVYYRRILEEMGIEQLEPTVIWTD